MLGSDCSGVTSSAVNEHVCAKHFCGHVWSARFAASCVGSHATQPLGWSPRGTNRTGSRRYCTAVCSPLQLCVDSKKPRPDSWAGRHKQELVCSLLQQKSKQLQGTSHHRMHLSRLTGLDHVAAQNIGPLEHVCWFRMGYLLGS